MNFFKKISDFITGKDKVKGQRGSGRRHGDEDEDDAGGPRKQQRYQRRQPLLTDSPGRGGGVQGFGWYFGALKRDEDGDEAHEFVHGDEVFEEDQAGEEENEEFHTP
ncbi:hypothetical protein A3770_09p55830 [Chloropicon primus]|uniref:Uncharacterized protein n=1 Tax=Chloropicon primus TaxID=1764295 RepID=A0A5B8MTT4_9CHLO|nr:hypothetical protein A3770_09p55830 [Chloropicon primus]|mmetsp:Transcript_12242/g.34039  ORF Transcript_12242/g.34039 Transcript_12242/m.34039 type:complete len:107 (-) Transcript_12242:1743-2063(-)|eukprot:QDZ23065.1 hypothetical protein A3770_09p55830 [Chloropicon primus]